MPGQDRHLQSKNRNTRSFAESKLSQAFFVAGKFILNISLLKLYIHNLWIYIAFVTFMSLQKPALW